MSGRQLTAAEWDAVEETFPDGYTQTMLFRKALEAQRLRAAIERHRERAIRNGTWTGKDNELWEALK